MYRLDPAIVEALDAGHTLIVPSRQRAAAVRLAFAWRRRLAGQSVWATPDVLPWDAWLGRELMRAREQGGPQRALLNTSQQLALWQQMLREDGGDDPSSDPAAHADGIATAAALVREWHLSWPTGAGTPEAELLRRTLTRMDARCAGDGLLVPALAGEREIAALVPHPLAFATGSALTPRQKAVATAFAGAGMPVRDLLPADGRGEARKLALPTPEDEHAAIGDWARDHLEADPAARLLVLSARPDADLALLREDLLRALGAPGTASLIVAVEGGEPLEEQPLVRAVLAWLRLATGEVEFAVLSAVLRGPWHAIGPPETCVALELWLRERMPVRCPVSSLLPVLEAAPGALTVAATTLARALAAVQGLGRAPAARTGEWSRRIVEVLGVLGHPGSAPLDSAAQQARERWLQALEEFASLEALLPPLGADAALVRLRGLLRRSQHQAATGDAAVTLTQRREDPVVGYDAIWVAGASELQLPAPARPDPFIPVSVQRAAGLPQASARASLAAGRRLLAAWRARAAGGVVLSHALTEGDIDQSPSVLLRDLQAMDRPGPALARRRTGQAVEEPAEASLAPLRSVPASAGSRIPELQLACAFRAQAELRLDARRPEEPAGGIDGRLRGIYLHRALERVWGAIRTSAMLHSRPTADWAAEIDAAVDAAFAQPVPGGGVEPTPSQVARERDRCRELLAEALEADRARAQPFTVEARERAVKWQVDDAALTLRVDRVDRLADGSLAVLDYKTGAGPVRTDLDADIARPAQLMAYLDAVSVDLGEDVAALALVALQPGAVGFEGVDDGRAGLPRKRRAASPEDWPSRRLALRSSVRDLVREHLRGDARVAPLKGACDYCPLPALCRIDWSLADPADETEAGE